MKMASTLGSLLAAAFALAVIAGCGAQKDAAATGDDQNATASHGNFGDAFDALAGDQQTTWLNAINGMSAEFDDACGDTFCEGDFGDMSSLSLTCSVDASSKKLGACTWVIAGATEDIDAKTGAVKVRSKVFTCALGAKGTIDELVKVLGPDPKAPGAQPRIDRALPGTQKTARDALNDCIR